MARPFRSLPGAIYRAGTKSARSAGRAIRRAWKPVVLAFLILNFLVSVSTYLESRYMRPSLVPSPRMDWHAYSDRMDRYRSHRNPYRHYETALCLIDPDDLEIVSRYTSEQSMRSAMKGATTGAPGLPPPAPAPLPPAFSSGQETASPVTEEELAEALARIQPAIAEIRAGAHCSVSDLCFPVRDYRLNARHPRYWQLRRLASAAVCDAVWKANHGDAEEGMTQLLDVAEMGSDLTGDDPTISIIIGRAVKAMSCRDLAGCVGSGELSAGQSGALVERFERLESERPPMKAMLEGWYLAEREMLLDFLDWRYCGYEFRACARDNEYGVYSHLLRAWVYAYKAVPGAKTWTVSNFDRAWRRILDTQSKPYPQAKELWDKVLFKRDEFLCDCYLEDTLTPKLDPVSRMLVSGRSFRGLLLGYALDECRGRGLILMAALEAYRLDHGRYPEELSQLVGEYLATLPTDPFTDGRPFTYSRKGAGCLLYSVGPDVKDDGGRASECYSIDHDYNGDCVLEPDAPVWE